MDALILALKQPSAKKRDRTKDRQRLKKKQKRTRLRGSQSDDGSDVEIPGNAIYGPRGETKKKFDARC
jgi:hypothetical protein